MDAVELGEVDKVALIMSSKKGNILFLISKVSDVNHTAYLLLKAMQSLPELPD